MPCFLLHHLHEADECGVVFATLPRHDRTHQRPPNIPTSRTGGHAIWWRVEADSKDDALALLPFFVSVRTTVTKVSEVTIP